MADLFLDLLPGPSQSAERGTAVLGRVMSDRLYIPETDSPGAIKRALNDSGGVDGDVIVAGDLRQGKEPTVVYELWVRPGEVGSWSRESVRLTDLAKGAASSEELFGLLAG